MNNYQKLIQFLGEYAELNAALLIALVQSRIGRIKTSKYFTFDVLGESGVLFTDEMHQQVDVFLQSLNCPANLVEVEGLTEDTIQIDKVETRTELTALLEQAGHLEPV